MTRSTDGTHGSSGSAIKTYVDANINLSPLTAINEVGSPHTITATVQQNDGTSGWVPAVGSTVTFSLPSNPILASFVGGIDSCTTGTGGTCAVSINSVNPGTVTIHATTTFPVLGVSLTRATNDGLPGDGPDVNKIYVSHPAIAVTKRCVSPTSGSTITFYGTITNTGDTALKDISLVDNQPAPNTPVSLPQTTLAVGESTNYTGSYYTTTSPSTDTVTVSATEAFTGIVLVPASSEPQTCVLPQTRTLGFWATHTAFSNSLWVPQTLCTANNITATTAPGTNQLMGGFWSDVSKNADGSNRSNLSQARIQLLQQYFAAVLNYRYFHSGTQSQLDSARAAYCGKNVNAILTWVGILDKFNQSGDGLGDTSAAGNATSQESQTQANIPFWNEPSYR